MRRALPVIILCSGLAACAAPVFAPPPGNLAADRRACNQSYPPHIGNYLAHAQCVNAAVERDAIPTSRYPDLVRIQEQLRLKYSAQIDSGAISPRTGERKMEEADRLVNAEMHDRDMGRGGFANRRFDRLQAMLQ